MVRPELALLSRAAPRLGRIQRVTMHGQRKVHVYESHLVAVLLANFFERGLYPFAKRTLKVRELDDGYRRIGSAQRGMTGARDFNPRRRDQNLGRGFLAQCDENFFALLLLALVLQC